VHLRGGHDVVVPQLVARPDQVARFADAAARGGARLVHVLVEAPDDVVADRVGADAAPHRRGLDAATAAAYGTGLDEVAREPGVHRLTNVEIAAAVDGLEELAGRR
jgi:predicted kinase